MSLIPEITCRRCGHKYSGLRPRCPKCGAPRANQSTRAAATTASATRGSASYARAEVNGRWQLIFAGILAAAVLLAVVVLIASGGSEGTPAGSGGSAATSQSGGAAVTISDTYLPSPAPTAPPEDEVDTSAITSMELIYANEVVSDITISIPGALTIPMEVRTYPRDADVTVEWRSSNEDILTVDQKGNVTIVGADPNGVIYATIYASCEGQEASCLIWVPYYQAPYLTENRYTANR